LSADAKRLRSTAFQEMFWTRTGLLLVSLVVIAGCSLLASSAMPAGTGKTLVAALATGSMVSAFVGFWQTLITASASQRAMVTPLIEESRSALRELSEEYRSLNQEFFPTHVFEASADPDPAFNHMLMRDLRETRQYWFRGFSARHAAARLLVSQSEWELRTVIADPQEPSAISGRARYLTRQEGAEANYDMVQQRLHEDVHIGLVGLYLARTRCTRVDITVITDPPLDRLEMFDDSAWITLYSDVAGATTLYPRSLRFSSSSFIYTMERAEFSRISNSRYGRHFLITPDTDRGDFKVLFEQVTGRTLTEEALVGLEAKFHEFRKEFAMVAELGR
jgi:hypothetical protein